MRRFIVLAVIMTAVLLSAAVSLAAEAPALTAAQAAAVKALIGRYIHDHPQEVLKAINDSEDQAKADAEDARRKLIVAHSAELDGDRAAPTLGTATPDVTIVEFFDYRCPYCKLQSGTIEQLAKDDRKLKIVLKDWPILGPESLAVSKVALVAQKHGKYAEFYEGAFALPQKITADAAIALAGRLGIDAATVKREMDGPEIAERLNATIALGKTLDLEGTPTVIVGGTAYASALDAQALKSLIEAARGKKS